jgi:hypothetical protein
MGKPIDAILAEKSWDGTVLGHDVAIECLRDSLKRELADHRLVGFGRRVGHDGLEYTAPVRQ